MLVSRFPKSNNISLKAWSAADEFLVEDFSQKLSSEDKIAIYNDRFGYLACNLHNNNPYSVISDKSSELAIAHNLKENELEVNQALFQNPIDKLPEAINKAIIKVPKSLELYRFFIEHICENSTDGVEVTVSFMTKYFSKQLVEIAQEYFEEVGQSKAQKKSRLIYMSGKKEFKKSTLINTVDFDRNTKLKQYYGVFSASKIDVATRFLLDSVEIYAHEKEILDLGSGNGVIAYYINNVFKKKGWPDSQIHLVDDSILALESSKLNLIGDNMHFHYDANMESIADNSLDLIISNPPFHFEYEINNEVAVNLFSKVFAALETGGRFLVVYNRHLNYNTWLKNIFPQTRIVKENHRFVVLECSKL